MLLIAQLPDKIPMPDGSNQAVIWIAVACIAAMLSGMGIGARWLLGYLDRNIAQTEKLATTFASEMKESRETFQSESEAARAAHQSEIERMRASDLIQQNRAFETFERHVERLSKAIESRTA